MRNYKIALAQPCAVTKLEVRNAAGEIVGVLNVGEKGDFHAVMRRVGANSHVQTLAQGFGASPDEAIKDAASAAGEQAGAYAAHAAELWVLLGTEGTEGGAF